MLSGAIAVFAGISATILIMKTRARSRAGIDPVCGGCGYAVHEWAELGFAIRTVRCTECGARLGSVGIRTRAPIRGMVVASGSAVALTVFAGVVAIAEAVRAAAVAPPVPVLVVQVPAPPMTAPLVVIPPSQVVVPADAPGAKWLAERWATMDLMGPPMRSAVIPPPARPAPSTEPFGPWAIEGSTGDDPFGVLVQGVGIRGSIFDDPARPASMIRGGWWDRLADDPVAAGPGLNEFESLIGAGPAGFDARSWERDLGLGDLYRGVPMTPELEAPFRDLPFDLIGAIDRSRARARAERRIVGPESRRVGVNTTSPSGGARSTASPSTRRTSTAATSRRSAGERVARP